ncbi:MAG: isoamylase early set domain-containing protein [Campylobacterota bacterium]|nr:isoamylase early set domain-containing protein [Campylobacterota bacterium]
MIKITTKGKKAWVTFSFTPQEGESVSLCGEWSEWNDEPMKVKKSGEFWITKILPIDNEYQFGYRINDTQWSCDNELGCVPSPFGSQNSLLKL